MKLAFWKSQQTRQDPEDRNAAREAATEFGEDDADQARIDRLRVRARRRLIGAAALLLLVVILVPMALDPTPRAVPDNIPIELPSDRTPFTPKLAAPAPEAAPAPGEAAEGVPAAPGSAADAAPVPAAVATSVPEAAPANPPEHRTERKAETAGRADSPRIFVQAASLAKEGAARELVARLSKSGMTARIDRVDVNGNVRYRVRLGPYATREEAEHVRARLHTLGVNNASILGAA